MREIYGFFRLASRLANPFGHPSQVCTQVLVFQTCVDLRRLASPLGQGFSLEHFSLLVIVIGHRVTQKRFFGTSHVRKFQAEEKSYLHLTTTNVHPC